MPLSKFENNLSEGNVAKQLFRFSLPFLISNLLQTLYSVVDMIVVGQFAGTVSMSGVNIGSQVQFLITNMVMGFTVGATVLVAQYLGSGNRDAMRETIGTLFTSLLIAAAVLTVGIVLVQDPILRLIRTPEDSFSEAHDYFFITMLGTVFIFGYNALSAIMRGMGDSKNPLYFVAIACVINIVLDLLFVAGFHMGAAGAALATVISQAVSMILCILYLRRNDFIFDFRLQSFRFHPERLRLLFKIGIPNAVQNVVVSVSFLFLTTLVNTLGVTASAAVGAAGKLNGFAILPAAALSASVSAMGAQNIGAGKIKRAEKTLAYGVLFAFSISAVIFALFQIFPESCLRLFGKDPEMIEKGVEYLRVFSFDYLLVPFVFCFNGLFIGAGHTVFSFINSSLSSLLIRIPASYLFGMVFHMGLTGVGLGAPFASFFSLILGVLFLVSGKWKKMVVVHRLPDDTEAETAPETDAGAEG